MREDFAGVAREHTEQSVFEGCQVHFLAVAPHASGRVVDAQTTVLVHGLLGSALQSALAIEPAQRDAQPREQLFHRKGLHQIVIGARVESVHLVGVLLAGGQHDDGKLRPGAHGADDLHPVAVRQAEVQNGQIRRLR